MKISVIDMEVITVREFQDISEDTIFDVCYKKRKNSKDLALSLSKQIFKDLKEFIYLSANQEDTSEITKFFKIQMKRGREIITPQNYVGVISISDKIQIEILPKIRLLRDDDKKLRKIFLRMLESTLNFENKHSLFNDANLQEENISIFEVLIAMYLEQANNLVKVGLKSDYISREDNLNFFKGKFLVDQHLKVNSFRKDRFYMSFDEFQKDRPENRLIKSTIHKLKKLTKSYNNERLANRLLSDFDDVSFSKNYFFDFSQVKLDRNMNGYRELLEWSKIFLNDKGVSTFSGNSKVTSLLFPMEKLFESYVAQQMAKLYKDKRVISQVGKGYLFDVPRLYQLRPDIYIKNRDFNSKDKEIILDTKWKLLKKLRSNNYGISQADMYQMYVYSQKYDVDDIYLLFPLEYDSPENDNGFVRKLQSTVDNKSVSIFLIDLEHIEDSLLELKKVMYSE